jgi:hypothetical protein
MSSCQFQLTFLHEGPYESPSAVPLVFQPCQIRIDQIYYQSEESHPDHNGSKSRIEEDIKKVIKAGFGEHRRVSVFSDMLNFMSGCGRIFLGACRRTGTIMNGGKE